jgi:hypothetical protein
MFRMLTLTTSAALLLTASVTAAGAQDHREIEREIYRLHADCDHGDRRACVRFGMILGEHHEMHEEWRRTHPEFFWYER